MRVRISHSANRLLWVGAFAGLLVTSAAATSGVSATGDSARAPVDKVCGGTLTADATFDDESAELGTQHACEHLAARKEVETRADRVAARATYREAVSDLPTARPAQVGKWSAAQNPGTKTDGVSAVLLHTGKVLLVGSSYTEGVKPPAYIFNPRTGNGHAVKAPAPIFCHSIVQLSDGRVLSVGGSNPNPQGIPDVWLFLPKSERWVRQPDGDAGGRYYPTSTRLANGTVLTAAGTESDGTTKNPTIELYTPPRRGNKGTVKVVGDNHATPFYPHQKLMPDGDLLQVIYARSYRLDTKTWQWTDLPNLPAGSNGAGSAGLLLPGGPKGSNRVLMIGGLKSQGAGVPAEAVKTTAKYNYAKPGADWTSGHAMPTARAHMNVVQVPNGSAYGIGGNTTGLSDGGQFQTMKYSPGSDTWTNMAVQKPRRAYHSTALLLPDGRIMSAGDDKTGGGGQRIDFYKPPYLFKGPRPKISDAPKQVSYKKKAFRIGTAGKRATRAVLMAPAATTHANDMNARHVELAVRRVGGGFRARTPGRTVAPPGYYMLFTVTAGGVPSVAKWVHLG